MAGPTAHNNPSPAQVDNPFGQRQSEPVPVRSPCFIALVELFKDMPLHLRGHADSGIGNFNTHVLGDSVKVTDRFPYSLENFTAFPRMLIHTCISSSSLP